MEYKHDTHHWTVKLRREHKHDVEIGKKTKKDPSKKLLKQTKKANFSQTDF